MICSVTVVCSSFHSLHNRNHITIMRDAVRFNTWLALWDQVDWSECCKTMGLVVEAGNCKAISLRVYIDWHCQVKMLQDWRLDEGPWLLLIHGFSIPGPFQFKLCSCPQHFAYFRLVWVWCCALCIIPHTQQVDVPELEKHLRILKWLWYLPLITGWYTVQHHAYSIKLNV